MKSKIYEFDPVIYPFTIHITKEFDKKELKKKYKAIEGEENEVPITNEFDASKTTTARVVNVVDTENFDNFHYLILIFRPQMIGAGVCSHEAVHVANCYLQYLGFSSPAAYNDEPYAYFVQWVTSCISSVISDETDKMKGKLI